MQNWSHHARAPSTLTDETFSFSTIAMSHDALCRIQCCYLCL